MGRVFRRCLLQPPAASGGKQRRFRRACQGRALTVSGDGFPHGPGTLLQCCTTIRLPRPFAVSEGTFPCHKPCRCPQPVPRPLRTSLAPCSLHAPVRHLQAAVRSPYAFSSAGCTKPAPLVSAPVCCAAAARQLGGLRWACCSVAPSAWARGLGIWVQWGGGLGYGCNRAGAWGCGCNGAEGLGIWVHWGGGLGRWVQLGRGLGTWAQRGRGLGIWVQ